YIFAKQQGGKMRLRIEDTDKERSKPEHEQYIYDSMKWLGLEADGEVFVQSKRTDIYQKKLKQLIEAGYAYVSKEEQKEVPGPDQKKLRSEVIRFKNPNVKITFNDLIRGEITFDTTDLGDFVLAKSLDEPLYHLTVVVDDMEMGVTHIIRGEDHISNTPRQILIQQALGAPQPIYAHLPLILATDRSKLSKRKHGESVATLYYRDQGYLPEALINFMALLGWNPGTDQEIFSLSELIEKFDISKVQKGGAIFDITKLQWLNKEHMSKMDQVLFGQEVLARIPEKLKSAPTFSERFPAVLPLIKERISYFGEVGTMAEEGEFDYFFISPSFIGENEKAKLASILPPEKLRKDKIVTKENTATILKKIMEILTVLDGSSWQSESIKAALWPYAEEQGRGLVLWPMRYVLSAREKSPDPFMLAAILGKDETLTRLANAVKALV
ncbi:MAG: glutamate--tRNA ligase family protein, partial [Candidatus Pacebacteria bacterium]|nr:glutamate--tRNA ligase family protein [Candidatus Paceibacterota bacterium]